MAQHQRFHIRDITQLRAEMAALKIDLPVETNLSVLAETVRLGARTMPNRFAVQPMEGFDAVADGGPGELAFRRYKRYAAGGSGLIWFEATAVLQEARSNPGQFYLHAGNVDVYKKLVAETRAAARDTLGCEPVLIVQLTHSGRYSKPFGQPRPIIAHRSPILDPKHNLPADYPVVTDDYLDRLQDTFVNAAKLAAQAGFDGIDIKSCHRYLMSELLASFTREGKYGGSFENRTRLLRETLARVKAEVPGVFICTRMNAYDAIPHPYGFGVNRDNYQLPDLAEPIQLAEMLAALGIAVLNISIGNPYYNPHYGRPFDFAIKGLAVPDEHPLEAIARFSAITRSMQQAIPNVPVVASGYSWLRHLMPAVAAGVIRTGGAGIIGQGRGAFAYPDSVNDILKNGRMIPEKCCVTCSACTQIMRDGGMTGCVVRDSFVYGPQYRLARRFSLDRLIEEAKRCRDCDLPTCVCACPAHVNVPGFIRAFADGDIRMAYDILRSANALPEMCAYVCPSEVQCEGHCVEDIFCKNPVPIRDIQLVVSRIARQEGYAGVRLPAKTSSRHVAVAGGGPAGIACAVHLLELGHRVTLFERARELGGTPHSIIPDLRYRGAGDEVMAILKPALTAGRLTLKLGETLGDDVIFADLRRDYDAVFIGVGLGNGDEPHKEKGVVEALDFLREVKTGKRSTMPSRVAVVGGGNTAMDAGVTAKLQGATDVYLLYRRSFAEMPAWPAERAHLLEAGVHLLILTQPAGFVHDATGRLTGIKIVRTVLGDADASGRRRPIAVPDSESILPVDLVIEATGQSLPDNLRTALQPVEFTTDGLIVIKPGTHAASLPKVFAAGDLVNGGTTAVQAIAEGMVAADEIDASMRRE